ncbi:MAG: FAD-binding oxidoreductase, partial [Candidatus Thermoplasmatota archaeon]|nr:FAD-binding oxidoreductase [Candidatus Thermoplasmatota archaeon]
MVDDEWDTMVIGAGVLGSATAYHLLRADPDLLVLLLDRHPRPAMGNTRRSVALFRDLFTSSTNRTLAGSTIEFLDHVEVELGHSLGLKRYGYYWMVGRENLQGLGGTLRDMDSHGSSYEV